MLENIKSLLFGVAIGDALGVPVEFESRKTLSSNMVMDMIGYGSHNQPPGTFSDDSSLTFCLAEALCGEFNNHRVSEKFQDWLYSGYWTAHGDVFDVGIATAKAINKLGDGVSPILAGGKDITSNGNGSLMRISPLVFHTINIPFETRFEFTKNISSITHAHNRSIISCFYYLEFLREILCGTDKFTAYEKLQHLFTDFIKKYDSTELTTFERLLNGNIFELPIDEIYSSGYVVHTLEASIYCLLTTDTYQNAVLKAVNLGEDTDTTGAVCGGLAGILYGFDNISTKWINKIAKHDEILNLCERLNEKLNK